MLLSLCQSSHPPLAHHHPGHYQCFHSVNSHSWVGYPCQCSTHTVPRDPGMITLAQTMQLPVNRTGQPPSNNGAGLRLPLVPHHQSSSSTTASAVRLYAPGKNTDRPIAFLSAERAQAVTNGWRKTAFSLEYYTWWAVPLGFPTGAAGLQPPAR